LLIRKEPSAIPGPERDERKIARTTQLHECPVCFEVENVELDEEQPPEKVADKLLTYTKV
jgi:hypothetical protein